MPKQNIKIARTHMQNNILDLEKKYYSKIEAIIRSDAFVNDLLLIEKEIRENYPKFQATWKLKNKIKVPAERVIRHHIYLALAKEIKGIFPSPISSDFGVRLDDCIICIDAKTLDTVSNSGDIRATAVEPNQLSFDNSNHPYIQSASNLESIDHYSRLPVLTFIIKIIYRDDNYSFSLARTNYPSFVLACIPNGELSSLFEKDIIQNFKTYDYYNENDKACFKYVPISEDLETNEQRKAFVEDYCVKTKNFAPIKIESDNGSLKSAYYDPINHVTWWQTSEKKKPVIKAVKSGSSTRIFNSILKERFDSSNNQWIGYKEFQLPDPLA